MTSPQISLRELREQAEAMRPRGEFFPGVLALVDAVKAAQAYLDRPKTATGDNSDAVRLATALARFKDYGEAPHA